AVLDVGSSKLHLIVGERGLNKTFIIKSSAEAAYSGFSESAFLEPDEVPKRIRALVAKTEAELRTGIDRIFVGVPGEFMISYCKFFRISLTKKKKINDDDVAKLYDAAFNLNSKELKLIARSAVNFVLSGNRKVSSPKGAVSDTLGGMLTFYLGKSDYIQLLDGALKSAGIGNVDYFPVTLAEILYLFESYERDNGGILVDIGYLTSTFSYFSGDGILYSNYFSDGGGYVTAHLYEKFRLSSFSAAEKLKRMINISYNPYDDARYEFDDGGKTVSVPVSSANAAVKECLDGMSEKIAAFIKEGVLNHHGNTVISLTGGGISYVRGAKEYLAGRLNAVVKTVAPKIPMFNKPVNSSAFSLFDVALKKNA
ncbi:MAG: hypothetical protein J6Z34_07130, partial [Clostridia bacterium]|nr:hypothetical protein [Clostridia bacterium]